MLSISIQALFLLATLLQLLFWGVRFRRLAVKTHTPPLGVFRPPFSVILCARNEGANLAARLPAILSQDYPDFEVIVVDHASTDNTAEVLEKLATRFPALRWLRCDDTGPGKKAPLTLGIREARHDWIVLTDADCRPASANWLSHLALQATPETDVILGYGPLEKQPGFLNAFARFETVLTAIQYFSYALAGQPYMGVGRNLAYRKAALPPDLFSPHADLLSGDDDLTVNAIAHATNTRIVIQAESFTWSPAPVTWRAFFRQKSRHLSASRRYKPVHQGWLGAWAVSFLGFYGLGILALLTGSWLLILASFCIRFAVISLVFHPLSRMLKAPDLQRILPILDFLLFGYYLVMAPAIWWGSHKKWG
ncbi:MAG: glycosyltransferase [Saprospirales bacterium]|nr:glycosyltransferase [Saprospirales bacterium]